VIFKKVEKLIREGSTTTKEALDAYNFFLLYFSQVRGFYIERLTPTSILQI